MPKSEYTTQYIISNTIWNHLKSHPQKWIYINIVEFMNYHDIHFKKYNGQTGRSFKTCYKEHTQAIKTNNNTSK